MFVFKQTEMEMSLHNTGRSLLTNRCSPGCPTNRVVILHSYPESVPLFCFFFVHLHVQTVKLLQCKVNFFKWVGLPRRKFLSWRTSLLCIDIVVELQRYSNVKWIFTNRLVCQEINFWIVKLASVHSQGVALGRVFYKRGYLIYFFMIKTCSSNLNIPPKYVYFMFMYRLLSDVILLKI